MPNPPRRSLSLWDGMILIGATALGFGLMRQFWPTIGDGMMKSRLWQHQYWGRIDSVQPLLCCWTVTVLAIRLRQPRPTLRRLLRQPGAVACVVAVMVLLAMGLLSASVEYVAHELAGIPRELAMRAVEEFFIYSPWAVGPAVWASWMLLWLGGRWRDEPSWIDRAGRLVGLAWIVLAVATYTCRLSL